MLVTSDIDVNETIKHTNKKLSEGSFGYLGGKGQNRTVLRMPDPDATTGQLLDGRY